MRTFMRVP